MYKELSTSHIGTRRLFLRFAFLKRGKVAEFAATENCDLSLLSVSQTLPLSFVTQVIETG